MTCLGKKQYKLLKHPQKGRNLGISDYAYSVGSGT
nr:hypothetical protein K4M20_00295 [Agrobacterium fabrum]